MKANLAQNPGLLKLHLFCKGLRVDASCALADEARPLQRTRAGLGSGLELVLPGRVYVNAPVLERWVEGTPFSLHRVTTGYELRHEERVVCPVTLPRRPPFYDQLTCSGVPMNRIAAMQGTYLGIYPTAVCHYWEHQPRVNCKFCSVGLNIGTSEARAKSVADVVETVQAARRDERITFVHFNTGYYEGDSYLEQLEPYIVAVKQATGLLIGVQTPAHPDLTRYDRLRTLGVNNVSFCFELWDRARFREVCPGKADHVGLQRYLDAIVYCARRFDTTNGEIIAGLEPVERTLEAIDWITSVGAIPTVCVFRPLSGTDYADRPPPEPETLVPVFARLYDACMARGLPVGIAPNIKVSIVILPEEGRHFLDDPARHRGREWTLAPLRLAFRMFFFIHLAWRSLISGRRAAARGDTPGGGN